MAKFVLNEGFSNEKEIEAHRFNEEGTFVIFRNDAGEQVFAVPSSTVTTIERTTS